MENSLNLMQDSSSLQQQRVVLNWQTSSCENLSGVPKNSVLGSLLFLIYISDISEEITSIFILFADDTSLFSVVKNDKLSQINLTLI